MPSLLDPILRVIGRDRQRSVGVCAVCRRPVRDSDDRFDLRSGTHVHHACATYRMRAARSDARRSPVSARRSALHVGD
ncbi:MAG TPA: hypothetical protein VGN78_16915 [Solirubrobacteraceae bacterium]|jgi:hypothetical protein|nr:hypothetical protein [Solirubrobacteraceae bacterium]